MANLFDYTFGIDSPTCALFRQPPRLVCTPPGDFCLMSSAFCLVPGLTRHAIATSIIESSVQVTIL